jgi:hypothetical protein
MAATKLAMHQPIPFQLSVRIRHPSMDPTEISTLSATAANPFNIPPQVSRMFGEMGITLEFEITND